MAGANSYCKNENSSNEIVFGLVFIGKTWPTHYWYFHEDLMKNLKCYIYVIIQI